MLDGVTGSGKTEVYLQAIKEIVSQGKQALILIPEIGLAPQAEERFRDYFGDNVLKPPKENFMIPKIDILKLPIRFMDGSSIPWAAYERMFGCCA